ILRFICMRQLRAVLFWTALVIDRAYNHSFLICSLNSSGCQPMLLLHPSRRTQMTRREMLRQLGGAIGLAAGLPLAARAQARTQGLSGMADALVSLTAAEAKTLGAIVSRIIPSDENGPGALEARADRFIDRALAGALKNQKAAYSAGLAAVDGYSQSLK